MKSSLCESFAFVCVLFVQVSVAVDGSTRTEQRLAFLGALSVIGCRVQVLLLFNRGLWRSFNRIRPALGEIVVKTFHLIEYGHVADVVVQVLQDILNHVGFD